MFWERNIEGRNIAVRTMHRRETSCYRLLASMADSDSDKTVNVSDADSEVVYDEANKKRLLSDSSVSPDHKRFCSVSESMPGSSDQDEDGTPPKSSGTDTISTESEDSQSIHGKCTTKIASLALPLRLSKWERKHIENLNISIVHVPDTKPLDLIQCGETENNEETAKINELKKYVQKSPIMAHLRSLDHLYTSFSELSSESLWEMAPNDDEKISMIPTWIPEKHMIWFYSSVPCLEIETKRIMKLEISGAADIIFPYTMFSPFKEAKQGTQHPSVIAVCEVKRDSPKLNQSSSPLSSRTRTKMKINVEVSAEQISSTTNTEVAHHKTVLHLDDKIIGQHGGELLFHFSDTIKNGKIFGLVVQETQVTFTVLEMSVEQYNDIVEGHVKHRSGDQPTLKVSKPYDYLKTQDREFIIEAFIKLAMLQRKIL
ncbi:uncharacterized protein LOC134260893 isoform X2 [Saccostrea cucullata]|uniref:uncharacterized protein LOC134260893 isoform X2 n=1 Tax=Saccostrea cuccullata TaxID=36930 RepID=UPI002ED37D49